MVNNKYYAVIGANYGDEGKGLVTNWLCKNAYNENKKVLNVLTNGGCQRGHTAFDKNGNRHIYSHFGSGYAYADIFFCKYYMINPMIFIKEYNELNVQLNQMNNIFIDPNCTLTTPYDVYINRLLEQHRNEKHGSCGCGIWETVCRNKIKPIYWKDIINKTYIDLFVLFKGLRINYFEELLNNYNLILSDEEKDIFYADELIHNYIDDLFKMMNYSQMIDFNKLINQYDTIVFENAQGLLLDMDLDKWGTPSKTGMTYIKEMLPNETIYPFYVTRSYITKHGNGFLSNECTKEQINSTMLDKTNIPNPYQGTLRYALFTEQSAQDLLNRIRIDAGDCEYKIVVTHMNEYQSDYLSFADYYSYDEINVI